jgi:hypothetical protein
VSARGQRWISTLRSGKQIESISGVGINDFIRDGTATSESTISWFESF